MHRFCWLLQPSSSMNLVVSLKLFSRRLEQTFLAHWHAVLDHPKRTQEMMMITICLQNVCMHGAEFTCAHSPAKFVFIERNFCVGRGVCLFQALQISHGFGKSIQIMWNFGSGVCWSEAWPLHSFLRIPFCVNSYILSLRNHFLSIFNCNPRCFIWTFEG